MHPRPHRIHFLILLLAVLAACSANEPFDPESWENTPPVASVWVLRAEPDSLAPTTYNNATFYWSAVDVDGFVVGFHISITEDGGDPVDWIFTTQEETTATYITDQEGRAAPTLYVVAEDHRGALSDTVSVTFPLFNFPPILEFNDGFTPPEQSIGVATFEYFGFDIDGDDTLLPFCEYRYEGSDPDLVYDIDDPLADPTLGWVRREKDPTRFSLALKGIPSGDPTKDFEQTIYVRLLDEAGGIGEHTYTWKAIEAKGEVLLMDDAINTPAFAPRDSFYRDAMKQLLPDAHTVWDISAGLPARDDEIWRTIAQFRVLIWYTGDGESQNLLRSQPLLQQFVSIDLDPDTPEYEQGRFILQSTKLVGTAQNSRLSPVFRRDVLGLLLQSDPSADFRILPTYYPQLQGKVDIDPSVAGLPAFGSSGTVYGNPGLQRHFIGLWGFRMDGGAELYRFEPFTYRLWRGDRNVYNPIMISRFPDPAVSALATNISIGFPMELAHALENGIEVLGAMLQQEFGVQVQMPGGQP